MSRSLQQLGIIVTNTSLKFDTLDIGLQEEFDKFLQERGVDQTLALFIPEYAEHKEQRVSSSSSF